MLLRDKETWGKLVYGLLYPGLLGSMIFDMADPLRLFTYARWGLLGIIFTYMVDYMHMMVDLKAEEEKYWLQILLDAGIAILFCFSYFSLTRVTAPEDNVPKSMYPYFCAWALRFLFLAYLIIFVYECGKQRQITLRNLMRLTPLMVPAMGFSIVILFWYCRSPNDPVHGTVWVIYLLFLVYCLYVFGFVRRVGVQVGKLEKSVPAVKSNRTLTTNLLLLVWNTYAALGVFATIWIAVNPRVYVYPSVSLDPANPVFTPFVVRNEGYLAIRDVKFSCAIKYIKYPGPGGTQIIGLGDYENNFYDPKQVARVIGPGEEASELLPLSGMEHNQFEKADVAVRLLFRPFRLWPFSLHVRTQLHRFELKTAKDGQRHWFPQPINK